jgi:hypothetical protein
MVNLASFAPFIRRSPTFALTAALAALVLQACGGGGDASGGTSASADVSASASALLAMVPDCPNATVSDSGQMIYVVMDASCAVDAELRSVAVGRGINGRIKLSNALWVGRQVGAIDTTVEQLAGVGARQIELVQRGQWRKVPHTGAWMPRDGAGLLQMDGALYLLGGWLHGPVTNEVWKTVDLVTWEFLGNAPWPARHGAAWLVHDNRLWVIGGDLHDDVWSSPDGVQWTQEAAAAPFGARYTPNAASINGEIVVYAGQDWQAVDSCEVPANCTARGLRSVWKSNDGRQWRLATEQAPWRGRALMHGNAVFGGEIWIIGGGLKASIENSPFVETIAEFTDIWSSVDGQTWRLRAQTTGFAARTHFSVLATNDGCYVSDGSVMTQDGVSNELFYATDCIHFASIPVPAELPVRHASSLVEFNGSLVLLGGPPVYSGAVNEVWQYFP